MTFYNIKAQVTIGYEEIIHIKCTVDISWQIGIYITDGQVIQGDAKGTALGASPSCEKERERAVTILIMKCSLEGRTA